MRSLCLGLLVAASLNAASSVSLEVGPNLGLPAAHGVQTLRDTLRARNFKLADKSESADYRIVLGGEKAAKISEAISGLVLPSTPESLIVAKGRLNGKPTLVLAGADSRGLMYAALDTAERIASATGSDPFERVTNQREIPQIGERGVSTYTMQRAYFEQRLYDQRYWTRYFDMLAADRINSFVVIFGYENGGFMAPLYPYFYNTTGFPGVELVGITPAQQAKNTAAFKAMMRIAHERGIAVTAGIWDHIYRGGVQGGGIPGASDSVGKRAPGLVFGVTADNLAAYTKASLNRFLEVFPEIDAIQFRMHDESGLKHEEMRGFWRDVFGSIQKLHPNLGLDLRAKELPDEIIQDAVGMGLKARVSTKFWMEQMGMPFHPTHINTQNQNERRHSYADLLRYPQTYKIHWQLWSGGTSRVLLWGDPDYVRQFVSSVGVYGGASFEVNEMLATKMLGSPHDEAPTGILNPKYRYYDYEFERYWHFYRVWGRLTYNPKSEEVIYSREFDRRFGAAAGPHVRKGLERASKVLPRIVAASYLYSNFPTTRGWAEMNRQGALREYANEDGSDIAQFLNVRDEAKSIIAGSETAMRRPEETSRWFAATADEILAEVALAEQGGGAKSTNEFLSTVTDLRILAGLARYHSHRLLSGVSYNLYKQSGDLAAFDDAIASERQAIAAWKQIVDAASDVFSKDLAFGVHAVGFGRHWAEEYTLLTQDLDQLLVERAKAEGNPNVLHRTPRKAIPPPPVVALDIPEEATPGQPYRIVVTPGDGIKSVRLRYRHVNQTEDYQALDMALNKNSGEYVARIPGPFVVARWDLMYYIEVLGANGSGRIYPDMETGAPYVIVPVNR